VPYLRFSRDKRGYENTYVLHAGGVGGKTRPRMLYWFRTPPNVKVGRLPLDEEAIRAVEAQNPDVTFDWKKMLKVRSTAKVNSGSSTGRGGATKRPRRSPATGPGDRQTRKAVGTDSMKTPASINTPNSLKALNSLPSTEEPPPDPQLLEAEAHLDSAAVLGDGETQVGAESHDEHPVVTLMGHETLVRLRARYAEIQARISEKPDETVDFDRDAFRTRAEALNPDRWTTIEFALTSIERFESDVEAIKAQLGRRPARSRRAKP